MRLRFPWFTLYGDPSKGSRLGCLAEMVVHEFVTLTRGHARAHARPRSVLYAIGGPPPKKAPGLRGLIDDSLTPEDGDVLTYDADTRLYGPAAGGGSVAGAVRTLTRNGLVVDLDVGELASTHALLVDPRAQAWEEGATYSLEVPSPGTPQQSIVHPSDDETRKFEACYLAEPVSGSMEPTWPEAQGEIASDGEAVWGSFSYVNWSSEMSWDGGLTTTYLVVDGSVWTSPDTGNAATVAPTWGSSPNFGDTIVDGDLTWTRGADVETWQADTAYPWFIPPVGDPFAISNAILPTVPAGFLFTLSTTTPRTAVATAPEPDWSPAPLNSGFQVIGGGMVWEETSNDEKLVITGLVAPTGDAAALDIVNVEPSGSTKVVLVDQDNVDGDYGADVESVEANRFGLGGETFEVSASFQLPVIYANGRWQVVQAMTP